MRKASNDEGWQLAEKEGLTNHDLAQMFLKKSARFLYFVRLLIEPLFVRSGEKL